MFISSDVMTNLHFDAIYKSVENDLYETWRRICQSYQIGIVGGFNAIELDDRYSCLWNVIYKGLTISDKSQNEKDLIIIGLNEEKVKAHVRKVARFALSRWEKKICNKLIDLNEPSFEFPSHNTANVYGYHRGNLLRIDIEMSIMLDKEGYFEQDFKTTAFINEKYVPLDKYKEYINSSHHY